MAESSGRRLRPSRRRRRRPLQDLQQNTVRIGFEKMLFRDLYAGLLRASWTKFFLFFALTFLVVNALFALAFLYLAPGGIVGARPGSFADVFFFSVQTSTTIGYGGMSPKGTMANILVTLEAMVGLIGVATATGIVFAKFARPTARVLFSESALINTRNGVPCLVFRIANERSNKVVEASVRVTVLLEEVTEEGEKLSRMHELELMRSSSPLFLMSWTVIHEITPQSPLYGFDEESWTARDARIFANVTGLDGTFVQTIHASYAWMPEDIVWGARFKDILQSLPDGRLQIDLNHFHSHESVEEKHS